MGTFRGCATNGRSTLSRGPRRVPMVELPGRQASQVHGDAERRTDQQRDHDPRARSPGPSRVASTADVATTQPAR